MSNEIKQNLMNEYRIHESDTGSVELQCAVFTYRIAQISDHLKNNPKDFQSRRGLLTLVTKRKRLLLYLKSRDSKRYEDLIKRLNIRK